MRLRIAVAAVLVSSLACGGGGFEPTRPKASTGTEVGPASATDLPPPPPEPAPVPEPAPSGDTIAVVGAYSGRDVAIVCTLGGRSVPCPVGPCADDGSCGPGASVRVVGTASLGGDSLSLPFATAQLSTFSEEYCSGTSAEIVEGDAGTPPVAVQAVESDDVALAAVIEAAGEGATINAYVIDIGGDPGPEILAEASTATGSFLMVLSAGAPPRIVYDTRMEPLADDIDDYARHEYEMGRTSLTWVGVTDAELDGTLEIVVEGSGYESSWIAVLKLDGTTLGTLGCAV